MSGYSLIELLMVMTVLGICGLIVTISLGTRVSMEQARGAAQSVQAAAAWGQVGVLWHGGAVGVAYDQGALRSTHELDLCGGDLGLSAPVADVATNVPRWYAGTGVSLRYSGHLGAPDSGGSLYFGEGARQYRMVVRPESGLTTRTPVQRQP